jgi:hypothetical protein
MDVQLLGAAEVKKDLTTGPWSAEEASARSAELGRLTSEKSSTRVEVQVDAVKATLEEVRSDKPAAARSSKRARGASMLSWERSWEQSKESRVMWKGAEVAAGWGEGAGAVWAGAEWWCRCVEGISSDQQVPSRGRSY